MRPLVRLLTVLLLALASACSEQGSDSVQSAELSPSAMRTAVESGQQLYLQQCAVCHGVDGLGHGSAVPALDVLPGSVSKWHQQYNDVTLAGYLANQHQPHFNSDAGLRSLLLFTRQLAQTH